ncbi:MAG: hypothetical protein NTW79_01640 [Candidatus Berkelbacteria bacterium]|nr:hypothetical protein [Candidatus Berkelbacteria bacterium]
MAFIRRKKQLDNRRVGGVYGKSDSGFFSGLDRTKRNFGKFWFFLILILVVFVLPIILANSLRGKVADVSISSTSVTNESLSDRLSAIHTPGRTEVSFTAEEFLAASGAKNSDFPLSSPSFSFAKDDLTLRGKSKSFFLPIPISIKIRVAAVDGKYQFIVAPENLGNILLLSQDKEKIQNILGQNIKSALAEKSLIAQSVDVGDDIINFSLIRGF